MLLFLLHFLSSRQLIIIKAQIILVALLKLNSQVAKKRLVKNLLLKKVVKVLLVQVTVIPLAVKVALVQPIPILPPLLVLIVAKRKPLTLAANPQALLHTQSSSSSEPAVGSITTRPQGAWVATFERNLYNGYKVTPKYYKYYGNGLWEVWVNEINTNNYPYVTVNQYNGNFHG